MTTQQPPSPRRSSPAFRAALRSLPHSYRGGKRGIATGCPEARLRASASDLHRHYAEALGRAVPACPQPPAWSPCDAPRGLRCVLKQVRRKIRSETAPFCGGVVDFLQVRGMPRALGRAPGGDLAGAERGGLRFAHEPNTTPVKPTRPRQSPNRERKCPKLRPRVSSFAGRMRAAAGLRRTTFHCSRSAGTFR